MTGTPTDWLAQRARTHAERLAVSDGSRRLTYAELHSEALKLATGLVERGVNAGNLVAIELPAGIDHAVAFHGALLAGGVVQGLTPGEPPHERERSLAGAAPAAIVDPELLGTVAAEGLGEGMAVNPRQAGDPMTRVMSSGTGGSPRPVELTYGNHLWSAVASALNLGVEPDDVWLCCVPLTHVSGITILARSVIQGTAALLHEGFDPGRVASALEAGDASVVSVVPTQLRRLLEVGAPLERARVLLVGGGPLRGDLLDATLAAGAAPVQTYGLTQACSQVCTLAPSQAREHAGSAGRPLFGVDVRIEDGEILVRGPNVAAGAAGADGWLRTGDLGRVDGDGLLWVDGRADDLIVTGGENVRPEEVEDVLLRHPHVADAAVVGHEDPEWGSAVVAVVVPSPGTELDADRLREHCRESLAPFKVPKRIELARELPRTRSGKLIRAALR